MEPVVDLFSARQEHSGLQKKVPASERPSTSFRWASMGPGGDSNPGPQIFRNETPLDSNWERKEIRIQNSFSSLDNDLAEIEQHSTYRNFRQIFYLFTYSLNYQRTVGHWIPNSPIFEWMAFLTLFVSGFQMVSTILFLPFEIQTGYFLTSLDRFGKKNILFMTIFFIKRSRLGPTIWNLYYVSSFQIVGLTIFVPFLNGSGSIQGELNPN
jgi:hypothetical protein